MRNAIECPGPNIRFTRRALHCGHRRLRFDCWVDGVVDHARRSLKFVGFTPGQAHDDDGEQQRQHEQNDADRRRVSPAAAVEGLVIEVERGHFRPPP